MQINKLNQCDIGDSLNQPHHQPLYQRLLGDAWHSLPPNFSNYIKLTVINAL